MDAFVDFLLQIFLVDHIGLGRLFVIKRLQSCLVLVFFIFDGTNVTDKRGLEFVLLKYFFV